ncbi:MAG TPA: malate synthase A [Steroidobacteraceae bacterium]|nr:malate synthase A [Steroidobacteraceae bacterium]
MSSAAVGQFVKPRLPQGVALGHPLGPRHEEILTPQALELLAGLHRRFEARRSQLLHARTTRQAGYNAGELPNFLRETADVRNASWRVGTIPADLLDRRVEITGPVDRKMIINALNSGAKVFMADFEDAHSPTWHNTLDGQINLLDRWHATLDYEDPASGKRYVLGPNPAVLMVRPRGWHLPETGLTVDGAPIAASLFDFGLSFLHNARAQLERGTGPYFYLPKLETHQEARLWNSVFLYAEEWLGVPAGTIKATVLIETLPAAFEMDEILYELREHIVGLNCGRWDYMFSFIKKLRANPEYILPDRSQVVMGEAFLRAYSLLLIKTCHRRGAFAMGGMAAQIPNRKDREANAAALERVRADKEREASDGHDGTWVAHPDLVPVAQEVFDRLMPRANQLDRLREDVSVGQKDLLEVHQGTRTEAGLRLNIRVGVQYIEAWLRGKGAVPLYNLMEDAATAEISRAQVWQWVHYGITLEGGTQATVELLDRLIEEEMARVRAELGAQLYDKGRFPEAVRLFRELSSAADFEEFLTLPAFQILRDDEARASGRLPS